MAKPATKKKHGAEPDLFAGTGRVPRAPHPRRARQAARGGGDGGYTRQAHRGAGGAGAGAPPARHVYRRHRREGAASPLRRGDRQFDGRGARRPRRLDRGRARGGRLRHRHRQRPRHPGRPASEVQEQVGARSHHVHAARRRQVRLRGLRDLRRPARRRRVGRQRAVRAAGGRGRARADALPAWRSSAASRRASWRRSAARRTGAAPRCASSPTRRSSAPRPHFKPERLFKMARSKAYLFGGVEIRWHCAPELLKGIDDVPEKATFHFADGPEGLSRRQPRRRDAGASRHLHRHGRQDRPPRRGRMGGRLDGRRRRLPQFLLQHHPDAGRRHARIRPAHRAAARPEGSRRARRPGQARRRRSPAKT